jgi:thioredoxin reductase
MPSAINSNPQNINIAIIGGGIASLSAAITLSKRLFKDILILLFKKKFIYKDNNL